MDPFLLFNILLVFLLGACIGSFLNVLIDRLPRGGNIFLGHSICFSCRKKILLQDLVPIGSFLLLHGRCRNCSAKIPPRIFLVEVITAFFFVSIYFAYLASLLNLESAIYTLIAYSIFLPIFFIDIEQGIIPDALLILFLLVTAVYLAIFSPALFLPNLITGIVLFLIFLAIYTLTSGRAMGFGDVKLAFILGFYLGFPQIIIGIYLAFLTGAAASVILILLGKKRLRGDTMPFGPFLVGAALITYLLGNFILVNIVARFI